MALMSVRAIFWGADMATALVMIDVQMDFLHNRAAGYAWANPDAESQIAALLAGFRAAGLPIIHVHHHGDDLRDGFHPDNPGAAVMPCAVPAADETLIIKTGSSAFIGTNLQEHLRDQGLTTLIIAGGAANYCVESTARMAGNLGFDTTVVGDALINFQKTLRDGRVMPAGDVLAITLATLDGEFAKIADTAQVLSAIGG